MALDYTSDVLFDFRNFLLRTLLFIFVITFLSCRVRRHQKKGSPGGLSPALFQLSLFLPPWDNWWLNSTLSWSSSSPNTGCCSMRISNMQVTTFRVWESRYLLLLLRHLRVWCKLWLIKLSLSAWEDAKDVSFGVRIAVWGGNSQNTWV